MRGLHSALRNRGPSPWPSPQHDVKSHRVGERELKMRNIKARERSGTGQDSSIEALKRADDFGTILR